MGLTLKNTRALTGRAMGRGRRGRFSTAALFARDGADGWWYQGGVAAARYQTDAGIVPAAANGDPLGLVLDTKDGTPEARRNYVNGSALTDNAAYWPDSITSNGMSATKVGSGPSSVNYEVSGTASATSFLDFYNVANSRQPASSGQSYTGSATVEIVSGSTGANTSTGVLVGAFEAIAPSTSLGGTVSGFKKAGGPELMSGTHAITTGNQIRYSVYFRTASGETVNCIVRVQFAQLEPGSTVTPYQPIGATYPLSWTGIHGVQPTSGFRPSFQSGAIRFDGSDDRFPPGYVMPGAGGTLAINGVFSKNSCIAIGAISSSDRVAIGINASGQAAGAIGALSTSTVFGGPDLVTGAARHTLHLVYDGDDAWLYVDGQEVWTGAYTGAPPSIASLFGGLNNAGTPASFLGGDVFAALAVNIPLTPAEVAAQHAEMSA